ncbi:uncharacterized protein Dvar_33940 [Desulfosarcina variabilis str. Montpellier]
MMDIGHSTPFKPIILQEAHHETVNSSNHLDQLPQEPFEKKTRCDPTKPSLNRFAGNSVNSLLVKSRRMKF